MRGTGSARVPRFGSLPQVEFSAMWVGLKAGLLPSVNHQKGRLITDNKVEKSLAPLSAKGGGVITNDWCIIHCCGGQRNTKRGTLEHGSEIVRDESPGVLSKVMGRSRGGGTGGPDPPRFSKIWVFEMVNLLDHSQSSSSSRSPLQLCVVNCNIRKKPIQNIPLYLRHCKQDSNTPVTPFATSPRQTVTNMEVLFTAICQYGYPLVPGTVNIMM